MPRPQPGQRANPDSTRLAEEMRLLAEAEDEAARVGVIPAAEVKAWIESHG